MVVCAFVHPLYPYRHMYLISRLLFAVVCRPDAQKKAYVKLSADSEAIDVANKMGVI